MNSIEKLIEVCKDYKSGILGIKEFQKDLKLFYYRTN